MGKKTTCCTQFWKKDTLSKPYKFFVIPIKMILFRFDYKPMTDYAGTSFDKNRVVFQMSGFEIVWAGNSKSFTF